MTSQLPAALALATILTLGACAPAGAAGDASEKGQAFLAQNAKAPGVHVTASGLEYKVLSSGPPTGEHPGPDDTVKVNYELKLLNGQVVDSSFARGAPDTMRLGGLIPAWQEAIPLMRPGDTWEIWSPASLAYGDKAAGPIPPGSVLEFKIELIDFGR
jgi:FKBP-type peptidyl-prolyl cis-trans isomerase